MDNYSELRKVQLIELEILKEVIRICNENSIEYFIIGGTALGAIRHKGFIPWDDDIDIGMTRVHYEKFIQIAKRELNSQYFLQTIETDKYTAFTFTKVRKNGTKFVEYPCRKLNMHHGIYIDIFPIDNIPDDLRLREKQFKRVLKLDTLFYNKSVSEDTKLSDSIRNYILCKFKYFTRKFIPKRYLFSRITNEMTKYNNEKTELKGLMLYPLFMKLIFSNDTLYPLKRVEFEGISVFAPNDCHTYLTTQYGDYMELPPKHLRYGHKPYEIGL